MKYRFTIALCFLSLVIASRGAEPDPEQSEDKRVRAVRTDSPLVIDGVLNEPAWEHAAVISDVHQVLPFEFTEPSERTEFYVLYDKDMLYIGGRFWDSDPEKITANILKQGGNVSQEDHIFVILDPFNNKRSGYFFFMNANNVRSDGLFDGPRFLGEWEGIWKGKATLTDDGWVAELGIPMKTLSFFADNDTWGLNVSRDIKRKGERISWVSQNRTIDPSASGEIYGLNDLDLGVGLDVVPSLSMGQREDFNRSDSQFVFEPSLNLFYKITPSLNGSLTINTDFSATEVDDRQVNLTRFSLFFPEKREFFLKDTDIFEFGRIGGNGFSSTIQRVERENARPFFSRTIGLSEAGTPVDLKLGAKLSGRIGPWNLGALAIRQAEQLAVDATDIFVARLTRNILDESTVGVILTRGDPQSNLDNTLFGADFRYRKPQTVFGTVEAEAWYQQTDTQGLVGNDAAWGVRLRLPNQTGFSGGISVKEVQDNFNPALGFVSRRGVRSYVGEIGYMVRRQGTYLRDIYSGIDTSRADTLDGSTQSATTYIRVVELVSRNEDKLSFRYNLHEEGLIEPFEISPGIVLPTGTYKWENLGFILQTAQHRKLSGTLIFFDGGDWGGNHKFARTSLGWRPSKHFNFEGSIEYNDFELAQGNFVTRLIRLQASVVFSDTLSWVNLLQFDNQSNVLGINSRLHWIPEAGREIFFTINHDLIDEGDAFRSMNSESILKINYTLRF